MFITVLYYKMNKKIFIGGNMENNKKTIKIKQSIGWNFAFHILQMLSDLPEVMNDKFFYRKYDEL